MKKIFLILFCIPNLICAQDVKRDNIWMLGSQLTAGYPQSGIDFNSGVADTFSLLRFPVFFLANASICDTNGQLLFYSNGNFVINAMHDTMANSQGFNPGFENEHRTPNGSGISQSILILPKPENPEKYIIFHLSADTFTYSNGLLYERPLNLRYSEVDMTLDNGLGAITSTKNKIIIDDTLITGRLTACKHANGRDWWIISHKEWSNRFHMLLLTPDTIFLNQSQDIGAIIEPRMDILGTGTFSKNGEKFAYINSDTTLNIFDFDRCTGQLSNLTAMYFPDTLNSGTIGCAFSPSGRYLYTNNNFHIFQMDMYATDIAASKTLVATWDGGTSDHGYRAIFNMMKLAPDDKIYISTYEGTNILHVIDSPDSAGLSCNVIQRKILLPSYNAFSMPNSPYYALGSLTGSACDSLIGVNEIAEENHFVIYPNPASTTFNLVSDVDHFMNAELFILNCLGQEVLSRRINNSSDLVNIDVHNLANGIYTCHLINNNNDKMIGKLSVVH